MAYEFYYCEFTAFFYTRFALAFLNVGNVGNGSLYHSFVHDSSFHDGFNVGVGVFGTDFLEIKNNVFHHTVGPGIQLAGQSNRLIDNLVVYSIAEATYAVSN